MFNTRKRFPIKIIFEKCIFTLCKLYPDSNIIGGRSTIKNIVGLKASSFYGIKEKYTLILQ